MAEVLGWILESEKYVENTSLSAASHENATGKSHGIVSLDKQLTLQLVAKLPAGTNPNSQGSQYSLPTPSGNTLTLSLRGSGYVGTSVTRTIQSMTSQNWVDEETQPTATGWRLQGGRAFMEGYEEDTMGVAVWRAVYISEGMDIKRLNWWGGMTPTKFRSLSHVS